MVVARLKAEDEFLYHVTATIKADILAGNETQAQELFEQLVKNKEIAFHIAVAPTKAFRELID